MTPLFAPAVKTGRWPRLAVLGPAGFGKTFTALALAQGFDTAPIGLVDTNRGAASCYAARFPFHTLNLSSFDPVGLAQICYQAADEGIAALVVDCGSAFWSGPDGVLEQVDRAVLEAGPRAGSNAGWAKANPMYRAMLDAIADFPGPVVVTLMQRTDWLAERDEATGLVGFRPHGTKPDQREGFEAEFDLVLRLLDVGGAAAVVSKTTMPELTGRTFHEPGADLAAEVAKLLADGATTEPVHQVRVRDWAMRGQPSEQEIGDRLAVLTAAGRAGAKVLLAGALTPIGDVLTRCQTRAWAMDPARTVDELRARYAGLKAARQDSVLVGVGDGLVPIGDVIRQCAEVLKAAEAEPGQPEPQEAAAA